MPLPDIAFLLVAGMVPGVIGTAGGITSLVSYPALLAAYNPAEELYQTVGRCGTGFSDAELAALPERLAPFRRAQRPARIDSRVPADVWFEPSVVMEVLSAELTLSPNHTAGWGQLKDDAGLSMRFPRFTGRWRDDKEPQDATTTDQLVQLFRTAHRVSTGA